MARQSKKSLTADLSATLKQFPTQFAKLDTEHKALEDQMATLKKAGLIYATPHYRPKLRADGLEVHFLYLLYPSKGAAKRKREYVGSDPAKVKKALDAIETGAHYGYLSTQNLSCAQVIVFKPI